MPPGRPRGRPAKNTTHSTANTAAAAAAPQSRLSFGPKNATNKITKPAATTHAQSAKDHHKLSPKQKRAIEDAAASAEPAKHQISKPSPSSSSDDDDDDQQANPTAEPKDTQKEEEESRSNNNKRLPLPIRGGGAQADLANASKLGPRDTKEVAATKVSEAQIKQYWKGKEDDRIAARVHQRGLSVHEKVLREFDLSSQFGPCIGIPRLNRWKRADGLGLKPPLEVLAVLMKEEGLERAYVDELMGKTLGGLDA